MAAVLALVMVPLLAGIGFFAMATRADAALSSALAVAMFLGLGGLVLFGTLKLISDTEHGDEKAH